MANYFVIDNTFRPYSFDELIKPYQMYGQAYKEREALLDAAREKEFSADNLNPDLDKAAYDLYSAATAGLKGVSDELATRGLSGNLRSRIRTTARDYKTTMDNLTNAQQRLYAEQDRRAKLGNDYVYQQNNLRIGDFLNGASPNQRSESLSNIANQTGAEFAKRASSITDDTWSKVFLNNRSTGYYDVTTKTGLTAAQVDAITSDDTTWKNIINDQSLSDSERSQLQSFRDVISRKEANMGFDKYGVEEQNKIKEAIAYGASQAIGSTKHEYKKDDELGWANFGLHQRQLNESIADAEAPYEHEPGKPISAATRTGKLKPDYVWVNGQPVHKNSDGTVSSGRGGSSGSGGNTDNETAPHIDVYYYDQNGNETSHSLADWNKRGLVGKEVENIEQLSNNNKRRLAKALGVTSVLPDQDLWELAIRRGVHLQVINHPVTTKVIDENTGKKVRDEDGKVKKETTNEGQELIMKGSSPETWRYQGVYGDSGNAFDPNAVPKK